MHSRTVGALAALALALPMASQAADFGYSLVDLTLLPHAEIEVGNGDVDGDGFQLRGSLEVSQTFFALVELQSLDLDAGVDATRWLIGAGGHWPLNNTMDIVARGGIVRLEIDAGRFDDDDTGLFVGGRIRATVAPKIEVEGGIEYSSAEVFESGNDFYLVAEGRYHFNQQFSAGALVNFSGDTQQLGVYGRFNF